MVQSIFINFIFCFIFLMKKIKIHTGKNVHGKGCSSRVTKNNLFLTSLTVTIKLQNVLSEVSKKKKNTADQEEDKSFPSVLKAMSIFIDLQLGL